MKKCARCGDEEFRIDGYCSIYCRDLAEEGEEWQEKYASLLKRAERMERALRLAEPWSHLCEDPTAGMTPGLVREGQVSMSPKAAQSDRLQHVRGCPGCEARTALEPE